MSLADIHDRQESLNLKFYDHAIIIGVGGIGSWTALNVALSGQFKHMHIIDPDVVEESNLNRTPFRICDVGHQKVDAMKYLILERRVSMKIHTYNTKSSLTLADELLNDMSNDVCIIFDCRDDIFTDFYMFDCKYYKLGYDGLSLTLDGNPKDTPVWGHANGYTVVPSFIAPAQIIAAITVMDALTIKNDECYQSIDHDNQNRFNGVLTFSMQSILPALNNYEKRNQI